MCEWFWSGCGVCVCVCVGMVVEHGGECGCGVWVRSVCGCVSVIEALMWNKLSIKSNVWSECVSVNVYIIEGANFEGFHL